MSVLYDAPGQQRWITVIEEDGIRSLHLDSCEEGAMDLEDDGPVFDYLWFHKCSALCSPLPSTQGREVGGEGIQRALVLGAGTFTAAKCLALDYPDANIDVVDAEPDLEAIGQRFFHLDQPAFARIRFFGESAEEFLCQAGQPYDFIFDDLFDGFQHVPETCLGMEHWQRLRGTLSESGVCVKNMILDRRSGASWSAVSQALEAVAAHFPSQQAIVLGKQERGANLLLLGMTGDAQFSWEQVRGQLLQAGVPEEVLKQAAPLS